MKRLISFVLVGLLVACHEPITEPPSPNFAARGCEPGPSHHGRGSNPCRLLALLAPVYSVLHNTQDNYYNVSEISTDEMMVPTRGQDWYDGGTWLDLHHQTWTATSPATLTFLNGVWNDAFSGITRANELLDALRNARGRDQAIIAAEARTLRAFYYYQLTDMFGGVPIFTTPQFAPQPRNTRAELFRFIETELLEARTALPNNWVAADYERMTKGAADAILASMYLNAAVFTSDSPSATTYNSCASVRVGVQTACHAAIAAADRILNSGRYSLAADWHSNFAPDNFASPENILVVKNLNQPGLGLNFVMRALHYNELTPSPWNGFAALAETYRAFDADDQRRRIFLEGPQVNLDTGAPAFDPGKPLTAVDRDMILRERLFELTAEAKRRQDLIRHGRYTQAWSFKQAGGPRLVLMPIPQSQLDANPLLVQNPGY